MKHVKFSDVVLVGGQPDDEELKQLKAAGFAAVMDLRTAGEPGQILSPEEEGEIAEDAGLTYVHFPVAMSELTEALVDRFREQLAAAPKPVLVHCASGKRAGACTMMAVAADEAISGEEALRKAEAMGFQCDVPSLADFVRDYVDRAT